MEFRTHAIVDEQHAGLVVATISVPAQWRVRSSVQWRYSDVSLPVRAWARAESPDGSAWVEFFPQELFYWLEPVRSPVAVGGRSLGMIHAPQVRAPDAIRNFVVGQYRGRMPSLQVVGNRPVDAAGLANAYRRPPIPGDALAYRIRYDVGGRTADEDLVGLLTAPNRIPYTGPQGTWYESHRALLFAHALGATDGQLQSVYPLLQFIATSVQVDPAWEAHRTTLQQRINREFSAMIANGYAQIQAAAQVSRSISANNDAMVSSMQTARAAQARRDADRRAAASRSDSAGGSFSDYIRGVERMKDPYYGTSEQSYNQKYHWTDGQGNYRSGNDPGFNPNVGTGGGVTWQRMEPAR